MSKFLKAKNNDTGESILININKIVSVEAAGKTTFVTIEGEGSVNLDLGFQSVSNRLKELGSDIA